MIPLALTAEASTALTILCLGSHSDDIEIGCGGTILRLAQEYPAASFHWVVFSANGIRKTEAQRGSVLFVPQERLRNMHLQEFRDGFMPFAGAEIKEFFEKLKGQVSPDLIFTHNGKDAHQDHRLVSELTWNTFRDHLILEYEIPKYDGDLGRPNFFVPLDEQLCRRKVQNILDAFQSQHTKQWFHEETFFSMLRLRGMECNSPSNLAEAFYCRKIRI
jgi:LmbE family N-acetylglucosaminyl deacetylase